MWNHLRLLSHFDLKSESNSYKTKCYWSNKFGSNCADQDLAKIMWQQDIPDSPWIRARGMWTLERTAAGPLGQCWPPRCWTPSARGWSGPSPHSPPLQPQQQHIVYLVLLFFKFCNCGFGKLFHTVFRIRTDFITDPNLDLNFPSHKNMNR